MTDIQDIRIQITKEIYIYISDCDLRIFGKGNGMLFEINTFPNKILDNHFTGSLVEKYFNIM